MPPQPGDVVENTATGERVAFHETAASTGGAAVTATVRFLPVGPVSAEHLHPHQSERHELRSGTLHLVIGGESRPLAIGESVTVPAGTPHRLRSPGGEPVELTVEARPALRTDEFLATLVRLGSSGRLARWNPLLLAAIAAEFPAESHLAKPDPRVQRAVIATLAPIARLLGYRARVGATGPTAAP